jgi:hypothetical protein
LFLQIQIVTNRKKETKKKIIKSSNSSFVFLYNDQIRCRIVNKNRFNDYDPDNELDRNIAISCRSWFSARCMKRFYYKLVNIILRIVKSSYGIDHLQSAIDGYA